MEYSFKEFQKTALTRLLGMDKYKDIIDMFNNKNTSLSSREFTKKFNSFYRVRRNEEWQKVYYDYFNKNRNNKDITFDEILDYLYEKTGNIEASFSSKMLSTINPDMPIWDQYVLKTIDIKLDNTKDRKEETKKAYKKIVEDVKEKLNNPEIKQMIKEFKEFFSDLNFSDTKILDFVLWNNREKKNIEN